MLTPSLSRRSVALLLLLALATLQAGCAGDDDVVLVLAAASTIDAMEAAAADFHAAGGSRVEISFGPTSVLARQIEQGAPAALMLSASAAWADYVAQRVPVAQRAVLVGNQLTVVVPAGSPVSELALEQVAVAPQLQRIAIADPVSVPAGIHAAEALRRAGLWQVVEPRLIPGSDVRAALALAAAGEVDAAIVYTSDAASSPLVRVVTHIDPGLHDPIEYPLLLLGEPRPPALRFFEYLVSARGRAHFHDRGFIDVGR